MYPALLTEKYLNFLAYDALTSNLTLVMGDKVPNIEISRTNRLWFCYFIFYINQKKYLFISISDYNK